MTCRAEQLEPRRLLAFGDLDPSFGNGGLLASESNDSFWNVTPVRPERLIVLADGRIAMVDNHARLNVRRSNGSLDPSFAGDGILELPRGALGIRQAVDGRIFVRTQVDDDPGFQRVDLAGNIDQSYGQQGFAAAEPGYFSETDIVDWAVNRAGEVIFIESFWTPPVDAFDRGHETREFEKLTVSGSLVTGFGFTVAQSLEQPVPPKRTTRNDVDVLRSRQQLLIDTNDRILVVGATSWADERHALDIDGFPYVYHVDVERYVSVVALKSDGSLDASYGNAGAAYAPLSDVRGEPSDPRITTAVALRDSDGQLLVTANGDTSETTRFVDFTPSGQPHVSNITSKYLKDSAQLEWIDDSRVAVLLGTNPRNGNWFDASSIAVLARDVTGDWQPSQSLRPGNLEVGRSNLYAVRATDNGKLLFGGGWSPGNPDATPTIQLIKIDVGRPTDRSLKILPNGRDNAIAYDSKARLHVVWYDTVAQKLLYKVRDHTGRWTGVYEVASGAYVGLNISIQIDSLDRPAIAFYDGASADLKFAARDVRWRWTVETIDARRATGQQPDLKLANDGSPWIAYYARSAGDLRLAHRAANGSWSIETVDRDGDTGRFPSIQVNADGRWSIASARSDGAVRLAERQKGGGWKLSTIGSASASSFAESVQLLIDDGLPSVAFYDSRPKDLRFLTREPLTGTWRAKTIASRGSVGQFARGLVDERRRLFWWDATHRAVVSQSFNSVGADGSLPDAVIYGGGALLSVAGGGSFTNFSYAFLDATGTNLVVADY